MLFYGGSGCGIVCFDGIIIVLVIVVWFLLFGVDVYLMLWDVVDFNWIEGSVLINLDIIVNGVSE